MSQISISESSKRSALAGHIFIILAVVSSVLALKYSSANPYSSGKLLTIMPVAVFCLVLLGKALSFEAARATEQSKLIMSSFNCDLLGLVCGIFMAGLGMMQVVPPTLLLCLNIIAGLSGVFSTIFFLSYLRGTAKAFGDDSLASLAWKLVLGFGLLICLFVLSFFAIFFGLGGLFLFLVTALTGILGLTYLYLVGKTGYLIFSA